MTIVPLADIVGDNAKHPLGPASIFARAVLFTVVSGSGAVRVGDGTVSATKGVVVPAAGLELPESPDTNEKYGLGHIGVFVPTGTTVSVSYVV